jgi:hypothetical protein
MIIFWRLLFGHFVADFTLQTNFINHWKRHSIWGMVAHCATHPLVYLALTWPFLGDTWLSIGPLRFNGWLCVFIVFALHFVEDQWRVFTIFKYNTPDNTLYFLWDQIIHYAVIFLVVPIGFQNPGMTLIPEKWPVLGCLFVLVTHACTVFVYFIEKDLYNRLYPGPEEKYITMGERLILALCLMVPGNAWALLGLGWLSFMHRVRAQRIIDLSWLSFYLGGVIALLCGLAARMIYYA